MKVYICAAWTRRLVSYFLFFQSSGPIWILKELRYSCSPRTDQQNTQAAEVADHWRITLSNNKPPAENNTHDSCRTVDLMRSFITLTPAFWRRECPLNLSAPGVLNIQESCWRSLYPTILTTCTDVCFPSVQVKSLNLKSNWSQPCDETRLLSFQM